MFSAGTLCTSLQSSVQRHCFLLPGATGYWTFRHSLRLRVRFWLRLLGVGTALGMAHLNIVSLAILVLFGSTPLNWSCVKILALTGFASAHPSSFRMRRLTLVSSSRPSFSNASCQHTSQKSFLVTSRSADSQALRDTSPELLLTHRSSHILRSLRFSLLNACVSAGWRSHVSFAGTYTSRIPRRVAR